MHPRPKERETSPNVVQFGAGEEVEATGNDEAAAGIRLAIHEHELLLRIGRGAYGEVWLARNALGTYRAVKVVYRKDFEDNRPFEREFEGIQKFEPISRSHEGLVNILQVGRHQDYFYYVMELADDASAECGVRNVERKEGGIESASALTPDSASRIPHSYVPHTLREDLRNHGRLPAERCVEIGLALTSALAHLHKHGLVHRDIKPSNIILVRGAPKLADIGLVTDAGDSQSIVGTEGYLPPEGPGTPQADIFSLGKVLYEISTGQDRRKFPDLPPNLKEWPDREALLEINEVVIKACTQDAKNRYDSADAMLADLQLLRCGSSIRRKRAIQQWFSVTRKAALAVTLIMLVSTLVVLLLRNRADAYLHSAVPEVNELVEQGFHNAMRETPGAFRAALANFNEAIQKDPTFVPAYFGLFSARVMRGGAAVGASVQLRRELREAATNLMQRFPKYAEAHAAWAMINWIDWRFPEALSEARLATQMPPASKRGAGSAHSYYGYFLVQSGKPDEALEHYKLAVTLFPDNANAQKHLGHPFFAKRELEQALAHYQKAVNLESQLADAHYWMARVFLEQTNFVAAIREFEETDKTEGRMGAKRKAFYEALREAVGQEDSFKGYYTKRLQLEMEEPRPDLYLIATLYARLGIMDRAYKYLRDACDNKAFDQGLMFDLCWNHQDSNFVAIAKGIHLME